MITGVCSGRGICKHQYLNCEAEIDGESSDCGADRFEIYSKPKTLPLVAFGLKKFKDKSSGQMVER